MSKAKSRQNLSNRQSFGKRPPGFNRRKRGSVNMIIVAVVAVFLLVAAIMLSLEIKKYEASNQANLVVAPDNLEQLIAEYDGSKHGDGVCDIRMNNTWRFASAKKISKDAYVENPLVNKYNTYITVTIEESEKLIYESPCIPVGCTLKNIKLSDESLAEGTYECIVEYHLVDDNMEEHGTVKMGTKIIIGG